MAWLVWHAGQSAATQTLLLKDLGLAKTKGQKGVRRSFGGNNATSKFGWIADKRNQRFIHESRKVTSKR